MNAIELESERVDPGGFFLTEENGYEDKRNEYERVVEERKAAAADYQSAPQPEIRQTADVYLDPDTNPMPQQQVVPKANITRKAHNAEIEQDTSTFLTGMGDQPINE